MRASSSATPTSRTSAAAANPSASDHHEQRRQPERADSGHHRHLRDARRLGSALRVPGRTRRAPGTAGPGGQDRCQPCDGVHEYRAHRGTTSQRRRQRAPGLPGRLRHRHHQGRGGAAGGPVLGQDPAGNRRHRRRRPIRRSQARRASQPQPPCRRLRHRQQDAATGGAGSRRVDCLNAPTLCRRIEAFGDNARASRRAERQGRMA